MSVRGSLPPTYFDDLYARDADPWRFATSDYERAKYEATIAALPARRFAAGFEVGCSIGVLTRQLADHCDSLLAVDVADRALGKARMRCAECHNVAFGLMNVPADWPDRAFDLILLSEVLYYLSPLDIVRTAARTRASLSPGGVVLLVHYTLATDYPCTGDTAADIFIAASGLTTGRQQREPQYRLDLLRA